MKFSLFVTIIFAILSQPGEPFAAQQEPSPNSLNQNRWENKFNQLSDFFYHNGHSKVPFPYPPNPSLALWVRNQKASYRRLLSSEYSMTQHSRYHGRETGLTPSRMAALHSFDLFSSYSRIPSPLSSLQNYSPAIDMSTPMQRELYWKFMLDKLIRFKETYGHVNVPLRYDDDPSLGQWVVNQRILWKKYMVDRTYTISQVDDLTKAKLDALDKLGFCYDLLNYNWCTMFNRLVEYKHERRKQYLEHVVAYVQQAVQREYEKEEKKRMKSIRYIQNQILSFQQQLLLLRYQNTLGVESLNDDTIQQEHQKITKLIHSLQQQMDKLKDHHLSSQISGQDILPQIEENFDYYFHISSDDLPNQDLKLWIQSQRRMYSKRKKFEHLGTEQEYLFERQTALESIGFTWTSSKRKRKIQLGDVQIEWISTVNVSSGHEQFVPKVRIQSSDQYQSKTETKDPVSFIGGNLNRSLPIKEVGTLETEKISSITQKEKWFQGKKEYKDLSHVNRLHEEDKNMNLRENFVNSQYLPRQHSSWNEDDLLALWDEEEEDEDDDE